MFLSQFLFLLLFLDTDDNDTDDGRMACINTFYWFPETMKGEDQSKNRGRNSNDYKPHHTFRILDK